MKRAYIGMVMWMIVSTSWIMGSFTEKCQTAATTSELIDCLSADVREREEKLARMLVRLHGLLDKEASAQLKRAESAWEVYRDSNCLCASGLHAGGSLEPVDLVACKDRMTDDRLKELKLTYKEALGTAEK